MKLIRLTSVFLCCALLSSFLILPASAADDDDYYSVPAVSDGSVSPASLGGIMLASATDWSTDDRAALNGIYRFIQYMTTSPSSWGGNSIIGFLDKICDQRIANTNYYLNQILNAVGGETGYATETTLSAFKSLFSDSNIGLGDSFYDFPHSLGILFGSERRKDGTYYYPIWRGTSADDKKVFFDSWSSVVGNLYSNLTSLYNPNMTDGHTFLWYVQTLQDTLASEDDRELADNYKENRQQAEQDFLTGKSGKTSLGKDDFGSLSSVGGTFKDAISLNGQSSIGDLTSGLSDADTVGQGWFSQATKDSLDAVSVSSSESTVSTFSDDGFTSVDVDLDPYHMEGFEDNYAWLWGDDDG